MKIYHYRPFFTGLLCLALAVGCAALGAVYGLEARHIVGLLILLAMAGISFRFAFAPKGLVDEIQGEVDERALFIATKSGHRTIQIMNALSFTAAMLAFLAYGFTRWAVWMTVGVTLCGVLVMMFVVLLAVNCYYERKY